MAAFDANNPPGMTVVLSTCCNQPVYTSHGEESTNFWTCSLCKKPTDAKTTRIVLGSAWTSKPLIGVEFPKRVWPTLLRGWLITAIVFAVVFFLAYLAY